jgi:copper resistance protein B
MAALAVAATSEMTEAQSTDPSGSSSASPFGMAMQDERIYLHGLLNELEGRFGGSPVPFRWDGEAWIGTDINRLWIKSEGVVVHGAVQGGDQELLYDRPISTYFDVQGGVRYDLDSRAGRGWAAFGIEGLAPQFFEVSATLYASDAGHFAAKLLGAYDELLTQRLILQPLVELNLYTRADPARDVSAGLSDLDMGLRLRYEITRKFAPYVGAVYQRSYNSASANGAYDAGHTGAWRLAAGVRAWL